MTGFWEIEEIGACDFAVVGDPIAHSRSPRMHGAAYSALGLDHTYRAVRVEAGRLSEALDRLAEHGCRGVNVTLPLKFEAIKWADHLEDWEGCLPLAGANTLRLQDKAAISTDEGGFLASLDHPNPGRVLILGAGGSAQGIALRLKNEGWDVSVWNRTASKWRDFADDFRVLNFPDPSGMDLIVNATSASLSGAELPVDWERASPNALAYDLAYRDEPTVFLQSAAQHGLRTQDGRRMLMEQGALALEWWLGIPAPRKDMLTAIS